MLGGLRANNRLHLRKEAGYALRKDLPRRQTNCVAPAQRSLVRRVSELASVHRQLQCRIVEPQRSRPPADQWPPTLHVPGQWRFEAARFLGVSALDSIGRPDAESPQSRLEIAALLLCHL